MDLCGVQTLNITLLTVFTVHTAGKAANYALRSKHVEVFFYTPAKSNVYTQEIKTLSSDLSISKSAVTNQDLTAF